MAVIAFFLIGLIVVLAGLFGTVAVMRRASAGKVKDENLGVLVRSHPYTLNPIFWTYVVVAVICAGIILIVWFRGR
ncbi:hypothetical protein [Domibacillus aminovorans]|uniref:Uncharacterized protein n=1 Tax=Domibacillus aminovorans TaxID=29332 RepID=A0A177LA00_9BACI|nr:hypothetical protein [Domibacillus aminovorans]OAH62226.1 hypothetical protein AWH49_01795 [Domibacillus aminovorans]